MGLGGWLKVQGLANSCKSKRKDSTDRGSWAVHRGYMMALAGARRGRRPLRRSYSRGAVGRVLPEST